MKIGLFTDSYLPTHDGVATSVETTAKELKRLGHEVFIVTPHHADEKKQSHVIRLASIRIYAEPEIWVGLDIPQPATVKISTIDFDIIHGHSGGPVSLMGWQIARLKKIPFVETYHTLWRHYSHYFPFPFMFSIWLLKKLSVIFGNDCDGMIAPSLKIKRELINYGVKKPIYIIPTGIELLRYKNIDKGFIRQRLKIPAHRMIFRTT